MTKPICVFYYGILDSSTKSRLISRPPAYIVLETKGGSYKRTYPSNQDIAELRAAGIKVLSYVNTGEMINFKYAADSPISTREFVLGCISDINVEHCDGIFFDEGGIGTLGAPGGKPCHADITELAPPTDLYGAANSWYNYSIKDYADYTHTLGMLAFLGTDYRESKYLNQNCFDSFDTILTDEGYPTADGRESGLPQESEIGFTKQCVVISSGISDALTAINYTNLALSNKFAASYHCNNFGSFPSWYEQYYDAITAPIITVNTTISGHVSAQINPSNISISITKPDNTIQSIDTITDYNGDYAISIALESGVHKFTTSIAQDAAYNAARSDELEKNIIPKLLDRTITLFVT